MRVIQPLVASFETLCSQNRWLASQYSRRYAAVVANEAALGNIGPQDVVLNVGCGAVPFTALLLAEQTGACVEAIDIDPQTVERAADCVRRFGLGARIRVRYGDGASLSGIAFTAAVVALQAEPKQAIFHHLMEQAEAGARLLFRQPSERFREHYDSLPQITPWAAVSQPMATFKKTVLYIKQGVTEHAQCTGS